MAKRAPNPYTKYGQKRMRQEYQQYKASLPPDERAKLDTNEGITYIVVIGIIVLIIFLIGGSGAALKWFTH